MLGIGSPDNPTGSFARPVGFAAGTSPWAMATGDFNADGLADLAATNNQGGTLSILLASAGQTATSALFAAPMVQSVRESVMSVVVADFDADGYVDVVTANSAGELAVYLGGGQLGINDGRFTPAAVLPQGVSLRRVAAGDFNDDGLPDLVALSRYDDQVLILLGTGTAGNGFFAPAIPYPTGAYSEDVAIADFNSDQIDDLAVAVEGERKISIFQGNGSAGRGDGTFQWSADYDASLLPLTGSQPGPRALAVADMNGDGIADLICANTIGVTGGEVAVLRGNGSAGHGNGTFRAALTATLPGAPNRVRAADLDGDGFVDLIATRRFTSPNLVVLRGRGDGTVAPLVAYGSGGAPFDLLVADATGDGVLDAIIASNQLAVVPGIAAGGMGTGAFGTAVLQPDLIAAESMVLRDLNADGVLDAVIVSRSRNTLSFMFGQLTTYQTAARPVARWQSNPLATTVAVGDETLPVATGSLDAVPPSLSQRLTPTGREGSASNEAWLAETGLAHPSGMIPITQRWRVQGDRRLARVPEPWAAVTTGPRLRVEARFGPLLFPTTPGDPRRAGLDLTPTAFADQRGLIITLPLPHAVSDADLTGATVHVYHATPDWLRADAYLLDPAAGQAQAAEYLPRVPRSPPTGAAQWTDLVIRRQQYREIPRDADGDLSTDVGPRFIVDLTDPAHRRIRVLTDALGDFQAFRQP